MGDETSAFDNNSKTTYNYFDVLNRQYLSLDPDWQLTLTGYNVVSDETIHVDGAGFVVDGIGQAFGRHERADALAAPGLAAALTQPQPVHASCEANTEMEKQTHGLLLCDDLLFTSRITGTARDLGFSFKTARSADGLREILLRDWPACIILDLSNPDLVITDFLIDLRRRGEPTPRVIAYGSHVDTAMLKAARTAGCDEVLTRSQFVEDLARKLPEWVKGHDGSHPKGAR